MPSRRPRVSKTSRLLQNCASKSLSLGFTFLPAFCKFFIKPPRSTSYNFCIYKGRVPRRVGQGRAEPRCRDAVAASPAPRGAPARPGAHAQPPVPHSRASFKSSRSPKRFPVRPKFLPGLRSCPHLLPSPSPTPWSLPLTFPRQPREGATFPSAPHTHPPTWNSLRKLGPSFLVCVCVGGDIKGTAGARLDWGSPLLPALLTAPLHLTPRDLRKTRPPAAPGLISYEV